jgi:hypothetical protein
MEWRAVSEVLEVLREYTKLSGRDLLREMQLACIEIGENAMKPALSVSVVTDEVTAEVSRLFDFEFDGTTTFTPPTLPATPKNYGIGLIVGASGSGKSTLLSSLGRPESPAWDDKKAIASHFDSAEEAQLYLAAVGLNSIPAWLRPRHCLSTGEGFRADVAMKLKLADGGPCFIDEFTSVVDRNVAKSCSRALSRYAEKTGHKGITLASCHYDIIEWLQPDWVFDTASGTVAGRGSERRFPSVRLELIPTSTRSWEAFSHHHYLSGDINKSSRCWLVTWGRTAVGFAAAITFPNQHFKNAWRGHRTVILPDFQGMGFGPRVSDAVGEIFLSDGCRYFSKTAHPRLGKYREASPLWKPTSKNRQSRKDYLQGRGTKEDGHKMKHRLRVCYSHEYIGKKGCSIK